MVLRSTVILAVIHASVRSFGVNGPRSQLAFWMEDIHYWMGTKTSKIWRQPQSGRRRRSLAVVFAFLLEVVYCCNGGLESAVVSDYDVMMHDRSHDNVISR